MESTPIPLPDYVNGTLAETARRPSYSREGLTAGIVHFGVGHFHRAHQAMYVHRLLEQGLAREWAYFGVGVMPSNARMRDVLNTQDGLYTLVLRGEDGTETADVIGSIIGFAYAPDDPQHVIEKIASPETKIITLTITEGGYNIHPLTGQFDLTDELIAADLTGDRAPGTMFGIVTEALDRRRSRGIGPLTIVSCDNIPGNGHVTKSAFLAYAAARDAELAAWVKDVVTFPNTMVDRIVPATTAHDIAYVRDHFSTDDAWPVVAEPWVQWIIEDDFAAGRPPLELAGVQFVDDVEPYELVKLRLLNATHQAIAYFAALADIEYVHEAVRNPRFRAFLSRFMTEEAAPTLTPVPGIDFAEYRDTGLKRFSNAAIADTVARLAADTSDRIPKFIFPFVRERLERDEPVPLSAAITAAWARYSRGFSDSGRPLEVIDPLHAELSSAAASSDPLDFLRVSSVFDDLSDVEAFAGPYLKAYQSIKEVGSMPTVELLSEGRL
jgi:mannitol 2-dehydrogenase